MMVKRSHSTLDMDWQFFGGKGLVLDDLKTDVQRVGLVGWVRAGSRGCVVSVSVRLSRQTRHRVRHSAYNTILCFF